MRRILLGSLFAAVSGFCSLAFQTLWYKQLALVIGIDVYATSTVIGGFLVGVGIGSLVFAKKVNQIGNIKSWYSSLEALVALSALAISVVLYQGVSLYVQVESILGQSALLIYALLLAIPPFFMGGTLLLLIRWIEVSTGAEEKSPAGLLYGMNIMGAVVGALSAPTLLLPHFGIFNSIVVVVVVNLILAMTGYLVINVVNAPKSRHENNGEQEVILKRALVLLYSVSGFVAIGMELIWIQTVLQYMNTRSIAYATILAVLLFGLMSGNLFANRLKLNSVKSYSLLLSLMCFSMISVIAPYLVISKFVWDTQMVVKAAAYGLSHSSMFSNLSSFVFIAFFFVFMGAFVFGCIFPLALKIQKNNQTQAHFSGILLGFNTLAGVVATAMVGFIFIPTFGAINTIKILSGLIILVVMLFVRHAQFKRPVYVSLMLLLAMVAILPSSKLSDLLVEKEGGNLLWFAEGVGNTVAVIEQGEGERAFHRLYIQGVSNTGDVMASLRYMRLQSYIPALIAPEPPKSALVIGLDTGITAGALTNIDSLDTRHVFELLPEVVEGTKNFNGNYNVANNPGVDIFVGDGRQQLSRPGMSYDLITLEPPPPTASGVSNLYSDDFYKLAKTRLTDNGVMAQWWPIATQSVEASRSLVATMLNNFKYVTLWTTEVHEMLLVGSDKPQNMDPTRIASTINSNPDLNRSLQEVGVKSGDALLATYVASREELEDFSGSDTTLITDDYPLLEFDEWTNELVVTDIMPDLINRFTVATSDKAHVEQIKYEQDNLVAFYIATMAAYENQPDTWRNYMNWTLKRDPNNAYYMWFKP
ncbi:fused MFS/spermidine synthase [Vibrio comitans]|uniref:Spermidine synthase n=1 Tax=Vibrio comitans NBRC 102076 TaxID=1219078 RepID=A0A4Y3IPZ1_9VIBR|nr:fused MFS/spermidine synthase [Vibrio comitans]GEA60800.1 hypothetical protein VCO01S_19930 [Vibrio comitans NBRC 102076]